MKKFLTLLLLAAAVAFGTTVATAADKKKNTAPKTLIHVVTVSWKEGATPAEIKAALDGVHKLPAAFPGITRVWTKTVKAQGERTHAIVMEFKNEQALKDYAGSDAQKEWYKVYEGVRGRSTTFDITN
jgi:hypothetical protein